jgi:hypothetical protein
MATKIELTLNETLTKISAELVGKINKSAFNSYFNSKYADLNQDILPAVTPKLEEYGVSLTFTTNFEVAGDKVIEFLVMTVKKGSEEIVSRHLLKEDNIQKRGAEITYLRRYLLVSILNLNTETDDDSNNVAQPQPQQRRQLIQQQSQSTQSYTVTTQKSSNSRKRTVSEAIASIIKTDKQRDFFAKELKQSVIMPHRVEIAPQEEKYGWKLYFKALEKMKAKGGAK